MSLWAQIRRVGGSRYRQGRIYLQICHRFPRYMIFYAKLTLKFSDFLIFLMTLKLNNMLDSECLFGTLENTLSVRTF